ncbi:protein transport protein sec31 [Triticum aestivum]|uniref:protein transport protein sec31 n=1 Tax=Triticum aestivum TaxID=4565 RepID=UPI001D010D66|nr:protein transport protein sec31-like [Triticum aestivum]
MSPYEGCARREFLLAGPCKIPLKSTKSITDLCQPPPFPSLSPRPRSQPTPCRRRRRIRSPPTVLLLSPPSSRSVRDPAAVLALRPRSSSRYRAPPEIQPPSSRSAGDLAAVLALCLRSSRRPHAQGSTPSLDPHPPAPNFVRHLPRASPLSTPPRAPALPRALHPCSPFLLPPIEIHPRALHTAAPLLKPAVCCCRSPHRLVFSNRKRWVTECQGVWSDDLGPWRVGGSRLQEHHRGNDISCSNGM